MPNGSGIVSSAASKLKKWYGQAKNAASEDMSKLGDAAKAASYSNPDTIGPYMMRQAAKRVSKALGQKR